MRASASRYRGNHYDRPDPRTFRFFAWSAREHHGLTTSESRFAYLILCGFTSITMLAEYLGLTYWTVKDATHRLTKKLGVQERHGIPTPLWDDYLWAKERAESRKGRAPHVRWLGDTMERARQVIDPRGLFR